MIGLTPDRKRLLELYVQCCKRSARRIVVAGRLANGAVFHGGYKIAEALRTKHMAACMRKRGMAEFTTARMLLQIAQSRFQCELESREYKA